MRAKGILLAAMVILVATSGEAAAASSCGSAPAARVYAITASGTSCVVARSVAYDFSKSRRGCSGRFNSYCHGYRVAFRGSRLIGGKTNWIMRARLSSKVITWRYIQGGE